MSDDLPPDSTSPRPAGRNSELLRLLIDQTQEHAVVITDQKGIITAWAGAATAILGYEASEAVGRPLSMIFTPEDLSLGLDLHEQEAAALTDRGEDDRWHVRKDGARVWISGTTTPLRDEAGELIGYGKVMRDRTNMRTRLDSLENRIGELSGQRDEQGVFFAKLSHEMRNSLAPLKNVLTLMTLQPDTQQLSFPLGVISRQVAVLTRLTQDLSEVARIGHGKLALDRQTVDLNRLLQQVADASRPKSEQKQQRLVVVLPPGTILIDADADRLHQVVFNLLDNAIKYTGPHGAVWLTMSLEGHNAMIKVRDNGCGMDADLLPRVFDLFTQGANASSEKGLGIGLSLAKDLVEAHGGTIEVRSEGTGKGSEFTVCLPVRQQAPRGPSPAP